MLTGELEPTNEAYAIAKLAMEGKVEAIAADEQLFGVIPADICEAIGFVSAGGKLKENHEPRVLLWGSGTPRREFLHVDDMATACLHVLDLDQSDFSGDNPCFVNVGTGRDSTISEIAQLIAEIIGFKGKTVYDPDRPDGTPRKLLDTSRINDLGWQPKFSLRQGLESAYNSFLHSSR